MCVGFFFSILQHGFQVLIHKSTLGHSLISLSSAVQLTSSKRYMDLLISYGILMFTFNQMLPLFDHGSNGWNG